MNPWNLRLERRPGVRYRDATFLPSGDEVLLLSDESGEMELHATPADGTVSGPPLANS